MIRLSEHARTAETGHGAVLLDIENGDMFALSVTGSLIVELLKSGTEENEIAPLLVHKCGIDLQTAKTDTTEFLRSLRQHGLVESA